MDLTSRISALILLFASCSSPLFESVKAKVTHEEAESFTRFQLTAAHNAVLVSDAPGTITGSGITLVVPRWTPVTALVPSFDFQGAAVTVNGAPQVSGVTVHDFTTPVTYRVTPLQGPPADYTVQVSLAPTGPMGGVTQGVPLSLAGTVSTLAGPVPTLVDPTGVTAVGTAVYIVDSASSVIAKYNTATGVTSVFAGSPGQPGYVDATGTNARFYRPQAITNDGTNLYVLDLNNLAIRKIVLATGAVSTVTGRGPAFAPPFSASNFVDGPKASATLGQPSGLVWNSDPTYGGLYFGDVDYTAGGALVAVLRKVAPATGAISTVARSDVTAGFTCQAVSSLASKDATLYFTDLNANNVYQWNLANSTLFHLAGGSFSKGGYQDGSGANALFQFLSLNSTSVGGLDVYADPTTGLDTLLVADGGNNTVRQIASTSLTTGLPVAAADQTVVATFSGVRGQVGGTNGPLAAARFGSPSGLTVINQKAYVTDETNESLRSLNFVLASTVIGTTPFSEENGAGSNARLTTPRGLATDGVSAWAFDLLGYSVRRLTPTTASVGTFVGNLASPNNGVYLHKTLYVTDTFNHCIRRYDTVTGDSSVLAGSEGNSGTADGIGTQALFNRPMGITTDNVYLYVADFYNNSIRRIDPVSGAVVTLAGGALKGVVPSGSKAGQGLGGFADDPAPVSTGGVMQAKNALFRRPIDLTTDGKKLFISDGSNAMVRSYDLTTGVVASVAGAPQVQGYVDGTAGVTPTSRFNYPMGITTDGTFLYVVDQLSGAIRRILIATGATSTVAGPLPNAALASQYDPLLSGGSGAAELGYLDGTGAAARFAYPWGITIVNGALLVTENGVGTVRIVR